ncbi:P2X purinoceptor 7 [Ixodes scapularis]
MVGESDEVPFSVPDDLSDFEKQIVERSKQLGLVPYDTPDRERDDPDDAVAESSELSPHPDLWRLDNTDWCSCSRCAVLPSFVPDECRCCRDMGPKLTRIQRLRCITTHEEFPLVCLNLVMLRLAYFELHDRRFAMHHDMHSPRLWPPPRPPQLEPAHYMVSEVGCPVPAVLLRTLRFLPLLPPVSAVRPRSPSTMPASGFRGCSNSKTTPSPPACTWRRTRHELGPSSIAWVHGHASSSVR